ncbi:MAG: pyruvate dehydrogenase (acetyl-transferring) E1 component subunit alpha [Actinomycetota bacterium]|nr:pyruvate dehydrogenase (acetyl-transferring) E1 component subunit alpha [Actinomycetota bacterium]
MPQDTLQILAPNGELVGDPPIDLDRIRELYEAMVVARVYDRKCTAMQKQGRLATYAPFEGQEACQIGAVAPLNADDWVVATYRDAGAMWFAGYPMVNLILGRTGDERGGKTPEGINVLPPSITVGGHMIHAVGTAWADKLQDTGRVSLTMFGDGATSEGDFHEAMNFAGVFDTPTVFFCQNNGWAISLPFEQQTAAESLVDKAVGYGMRGVRIDGNDLLAVVAAATTATEDARAGRGPTFIEAMTYRVGPHTTADDPGRYRTETLTDQWRAKDPIDRVRVYLEAQGQWTEAWEAGIAQAASQQVEDAVAEAEALEPFTGDEIFSAMFAEPTLPLLDQREMLRRDGP